MTRSNLVLKLFSFLPAITLLVVLTCFLTLPLSCTKENVTPENEEPLKTISVTNGSDEATFIKTPGSTADTADPDPETDCECYISVTSVSNGTGDEELETWEFHNLLPTGGFNITYSITGKDQTWKPFTSPGEIYTPLPCPPYAPGSPPPASDPGPPSYGSQSFFINYVETDPNNNYPNFTVHTEVNCFLLHSNGTQELSTTTYHNFNISEGSPFNGGWLFNRTFSCLVLEDDGRE